MDREEIRSRISGLSVWRRGDQRAPHKPLCFCSMPWAGAFAGRKGSFRSRRQTRSCGNCFWNSAPQEKAITLSIPSGGCKATACGKLPALKTFRNANQIPTFPKQYCSKKISTAVSCMKLDSTLNRHASGA